MGLFLDSFWRAVAYCLHPRVIALSFLPLLLMIAIGWALSYFFWDGAVATTREFLEGLTWLGPVWTWLDSFGQGAVRQWVAPLVVIVFSLPPIVMTALLMVAALMTPALASLVADRRFPKLERKKGGSMLMGIVGSLTSTFLALFATVLTLPLWLVPPMVLILPPLIWGWLTYRVMTFDVLADHASTEERRQIIRDHRAWLLAIGVVTGYLGAAPSIVWASGVLFAAMFIVMVPVAIWIYTLVFAFSSLWFAHYALAALERQRGGTIEVVSTTAQFVSRPQVMAERPAGPLLSPPPTAPDSPSPRDRA